MKKLWFISLFFFARPVHSEATKTIYNPFTGKLDYITKVDSTTLLAGSTNYIQNTSSLQSGSTAYPDSIYTNNLTAYNAARIETNGPAVALTLSQQQYAGFYADYIKFNIVNTQEGIFGMDYNTYVCSDGVQYCATTPFVWKGNMNAVTLSFDQNGKIATGTGVWTPSVNGFYENGNMAIGSWVDVATAPVNGLLVSGSAIFSTTNTTPSGTTQVQVVSPNTNSNDLWVSTSVLTPHLIVKTTGNVGLGTSTPGAVLDVTGNAQFGSTAKSTFTASGALTMASNSNITLAGTGKVTGLATPTSTTDAATKLYVDNSVNTFTSSVTFTQPVQYSSAPIMIANQSDTLAFPGGQVQATPFHPSSEFYTRVEETILDNQDGTYSYSKGAAGTSSQDTVNYIRSTQSLKAATDGTVSAMTVKRTSISPTIDFTGKQVVFYLKVDGLANLNSGSIYLSSDNLSANFYVFDWAAATSGQQYNYVQEGEWFRITLNFGEATITGSPNRAAINSWQIRLKDNGIAGSTTTVHWNGFATIPEPPQGIVSITVDDGFSATISTVAQYMDKYGFRGTSYVEPDNQSITNFMSTGTIVQLEKLHGWEIGLHPTISYLPNISTSTIDYAFYTSKVWMISSGLARYMDGVVYPHGGFNATVEAEARKYFTYARTIVTGPSNTNPYLETIPPADPYRLRSISVSSTTTGNQMYNWALRAQQNHEWLILTFHDFPVPQVAATDVSPTTFDTFIDTVNALGLRVEPVGEVLRNIAPSSGSISALAISAGSLAPGVIASNLAAGSANYIQNTASLQASSTFYVSAANVDGQTILAKNQGNVGIGITPSKKLDISDTSNNAIGSTTFWNAAFGGQIIRNPSATANSPAAVAFYMGAGANSLSAIAGIQESSTLGALGLFTGGSGRANTVPERLRIDSAGNVGIGTTGPAAKLDINGFDFIVESSSTPATSASVCTVGQVQWDSGFIYVCTATNTWKRSTLAAF